MSYLRYLRREKYDNNSSGRNKDTRWDRIRKRNLNQNLFSVKSDAVRRLIQMDFVGRHNEKLLNGIAEDEKRLNPHLVMEMRHKIFQKDVKKLPLATVANSKSLDSCIAHNLSVEEHYITNQLNKFRDQLKKNHQRNKVKIKFKEDNHMLDNTGIMESLLSTTKHINDFYSAPINAAEEVEKLFAFDEQEDFEEVPEPERPPREDDRELEKVNDEGEHTIEVNTIKDKVNFELNEMNEEESNHEMGKIDTLTTEPDHLESILRTPSPLTPTDEFFKPMREAFEQHTIHMRCVRFEEDVEVRKYEREDSMGSNTSDDFDSVISDLAEEALLELQLEEEEKIRQATQVNDDEGIATGSEDTTLQPTDDGLSKRGDENIEIKMDMQLTGSSLEQHSSPELLLIVKRLEAPPPPPPRNHDEISLTTDEDQTESNQEQNKIIEQLFQSRSHTNEATLRKYFLMWIHYTTIAKIERDAAPRQDDRVRKINAFLDKIRKEKIRLSKKVKEIKKDGTVEEGKQLQHPRYTIANVQIAKKYQNKIKIQQDIIDLQRIKLERQDRIIMELKLNKLSEEAKDARQELKNELKSVIRSGDPKSKAKAKCLQLIGNLQDKDDTNEDRLQCKALLVPTFLKKMQERALERSIRHEQARQRRLQQEAEKEAQKAAAEEAKRLEDEEAKRMRIEILKEKRRQEKMAKIIKERERQRAIENKRKSETFCRYLLLRRIGIEGFKRLLQRKRDNQRKSETMRRKILNRTYLCAWRDHYKYMQQMKQERADALYEKILKRNAIDNWRIYIKEERSKYHVAMDWYDLKVTDAMFKCWKETTKTTKLIVAGRMRQAIAHHEWHLKWKVLDCWRRLPQILQLEKETEERRQRWRMKIWELLPDYTPNTDEYWMK